LIPSARCRVLHGLPPDAAFSFADYLAAIHPDDRDGHRQALEQAINETGRFDAKYRVIWPDGSVHRVHSLGTMSPAVAGYPPQIVGASIEIAE
jgi:PAS domain-containing protein